MILLYVAQNRLYLILPPNSAHNKLLLEPACLRLEVLHLLPTVQRPGVAVRPR